MPRRQAEKWVVTWHRSTDDTNQSRSYTSKEAADKWANRLRNSPVVTNVQVNEA